MGPILWGVNSQPVCNILWIMKLDERVLLQLTVQRALPEAENLSGFAPVAGRVLEGRLDRRTLDFRHRHARPVHHMSLGSGSSTRGRGGIGLHGAECRGRSTPDLDHLDTRRPL